MSRIAFSTPITIRLFAEKIPLRKIWQHKELHGGITSASR
ncbi:hypothetical protein FHT76_006884 [Rhizobium sp. BK176]|nr:hypothetical protein [Rhizobium sp. BK181]MBB3544346.1 hypothetical protein [Rhizobium sp. BK399]MCS3742811.1 hypothetical protein [Rhizobium sp. BK661]MCS4095174.1 hypothetical protein [Rhizobium sp. BK176]